MICRNCKEPLSAAQGGTSPEGGDKCIRTVGVAQLCCAILKINKMSNISNSSHHHHHSAPHEERGRGWGVPLIVILHILIAYVVLMLARFLFLIENWSAYSSLFSDNSSWLLLKGCLLFDTSAVMYMNSIVILLVCIVMAVRGWQSRTMGRICGRVATWLFTIVNGIGVVLNLGDAVYFKYTGHRTTMSVFSEFQNENNLGKVFTTEILQHWYLFICGIVLIVFLYCSSRGVMNIVRTSDKVDRKEKLVAMASSLLTLIVFTPLCIAGIRGGFTTAVRPITISNANQYVKHPQEAALILNTPFSLIRTIGKSVFHDPGYFTDEELNKIYTPLHNSHFLSEGKEKNSGLLQLNAPSLMEGRGGSKNVVILIVESFGREYMGGYNVQRDGTFGMGPADDTKPSGYRGYTPFIDSLLPECLTFDYTFANGRQSIDGMPSILSGIPRFIEPFFLTPASMNDVSGIAGELANEGYHSAFFHGAENGSMGFEAFAKASGFKEYYGRTEFNQDKRFGGDADFDGTWAIWDEPFLQFYAQKMTEFHEPFVTTVFTASSHHPYVVPEKYSDIYKDDKAHCLQTGGTNPIHKCIQYTDMALQRFFETARKQPWFKNTIFVLTSDHTNIYDHKEYATDLGLFGAPLLFYDPSGKMPRGRRHCIAQQTDIMPTLLSYLGYQRPYVAWGIDLLNTPDEETWAVNHSGGMYQFVKGDYLLQFDGQQLTAVYDYKKDWMLKKNLLHDHKFDAPCISAMERQLKGIIQTYMQRMVNNKLKET